MKCVVHIGTAKTGTSSLQKFLHMNDDALLEQGVAYSRAFGRRNNRKLATLGAGANNPDSSFQILGLDTPEAFASFETEVLRDFDAEVEGLLARGDIHTYVISNEHLYSRLGDPEQIIRIKTILQRNFDEIKIVYALRPQADLALSRLSTAARRGEIVRSARFFPDEDDDRSIDETESGYFSYYRLWKAHFRNVLVVPYKRRPDTIANFVDLLDLDVGQLKMPKRANRALDYRTIQLLGILGDARLKDGRVDPNIGVFLSEFPGDEALSVSRDMVRRRQQPYQASNEALCEICEGLTIDDLTPDYDRFPEVGNIELLDADVPAAPQIAWLFKRYNAQVSLLQATLDVQGAELAILKGEMDDADTRLNEAEAHLERVLQSKMDVPTRRAKLLAGRSRRLRQRAQGR